MDTSHDLLGRKAHDFPTGERMKKLSVLLGCLLAASLTMANAQTPTAGTATDNAGAKTTQATPKPTVKKRIKKRSKRVARKAGAEKITSPNTGSAVAPHALAPAVVIAGIGAMPITAQAASAPPPARPTPASSAAIAPPAIPPSYSYTPKVSAWQSDAPYVNPYLAYQGAPATSPAPRPAAAPTYSAPTYTPPTYSPAQATAPAYAPPAYTPPPAAPRNNAPAASAPISQPSTASSNPFASLGNPLDGLKSLLPSGFSEMSILPSIKTVYPTGEKPLVVLTLKCPTELVGIATPSTMILHEVINGGMGLINRTNLLSFNMEQVCQ